MLNKKELIKQEDKKQDGISKFHMLVDSSELLSKEDKNNYHNIYDLQKSHTQKKESLDQILFNISEIEKIIITKQEELSHKEDFLNEIKDNLKSLQVETNTLNQQKSLLQNKKIKLNQEINQIIVSNKSSFEKIIHKQNQSNTLFREHNQLVKTIDKMTHSNDSLKKRASSLLYKNNQLKALNSLHEIEQKKISDQSIALKKEVTVLNSKRDDLVRYINDFKYSISNKIEDLTSNSLSHFSYQISKRSIFINFIEIDEQAESKFEISKSFEKLISNCIRHSIDKCLQSINIQHLGIYFVISDDRVDFNLAYSNKELDLNNVQGLSNSIPSYSVRVGNDSELFDKNVFVACRNKKDGSVYNVISYTLNQFEENKSEGPKRREDTTPAATSFF